MPAVGYSRAARELPLVAHPVRRDQQHRLEQPLRRDDADVAPATVAGAPTIDGRPVDPYIASNTGDSFDSPAAASFLIARSVAGTRVSGDINISIDDCFVFSPRIVRSEVGSMRLMSTPAQPIRQVHR